MKQGGNLHWTLGGSYVGFSTIGANRDEFVIIRKCETVLWEDEDMEERKEAVR